MPEEIVVKEIKLDNKVICKYHVDESNILYINVIDRNYPEQGAIGELEINFQRIISIIENRKFYGLAYLNV